MRNDSQSRWRRHESAWPGYDEREDGWSDNRSERWSQDDWQGESGDSVWARARRAVGMAPGQLSEGGPPRGGLEADYGGGYGEGRYGEGRYGDSRYPERGYGEGRYGHGRHDEPTGNIGDSHRPYGSGSDADRDHGGYESWSHQDDGMASGQRFGGGRFSRQSETSLERAYASRVGAYGERDADRYGNRYGNRYGSAGGDGNFLGGRRGGNWGDSGRTAWEPRRGVQHSPASPRYGDWDAHREHGGARGMLYELGHRIGEAVGGLFGQDEGTRAAPRRRVGPKGYRRSDERIHEAVCERLAYADGIDLSDVAVTVTDGVVKLTGTVRSRNEKYDIEDIADNVFGVTDVDNALRVRASDPSSPEKMTDVKNWTPD